MHTFSKQHGISMLELIIAMTLGLFVGAAITQVYLSNKVTSRYQDEMARLQENGRFAIDLIARDLRSADYFGCVGDKTRVVNHIKNELRGDMDINRAVSGVDGGEDNPDSLSIVGSSQIDEQFLKVSAPFNKDASIPLTVNNFNLNDLVGQALVVGDCQHSDIFIVSGVNGSALTHDLEQNNNSGACGLDQHCFSESYTDRTFLYRLFSANYAVEDESLIRTYNGERMTVANGVSDFQVHFGVDIDDDGVANRYVNQNNVTDFNQVVSIKIHLLVSSPSDNVTQTEQSIQFNWVENMDKENIDDVNDERLKKTQNDKRLRFPFTATIAVRNRLS